MSHLYEALEIKDGTQLGNSNDKMVQLMLEQHPDGVKVADKDGLLPLHWAARTHSNVEKVQWLWGNIGMV
jgi:hypothetical protein